MNNNQENVLLLSHNNLKQQEQHKYDSIIDINKTENNINNHIEMIDNSNFRFISIIASTINVLIGISIFSVPWALKEAGIIFGSILVIITSLLSYQTLKILIISQNIEFNQTGIVRNYPDLASFVLNNDNINKLVKIATIISCFGGCVGQLIFFCENMSQLFDIHVELTIIISFIPLIILSIYKSRKELSKFALFTTFTVMISILTIFYNGLIINKENKNNYFKPANFSKYGFEAIGSFTKIFTIHYCTLLVNGERLNGISKSKYYNYLKLNKSSLNFNNNNNNNINNDHVNAFLLKPIAISYIIATILVILIGVPIVFYYGEVDFVLNSEGHIGHGCNDHLCQNVLMNVPQGIMKYIIGIALSLSVMISYSLLITPAREYIELYVANYYINYKDYQINVIINIIRILIIIFTGIIALITPYFGSVLGTVGGISDSFLGFVLPPIIYIHINQGNQVSNKNKKIIYYCICFYGITVMIYTIYKLIEDNYKLVIKNIINNNYFLQ